MACPAPGVRHMAKPFRREALEDDEGPHTQPAARGRNISGAPGPVPATHADVLWHFNPYQHGGKLYNQKLRVSKGNVDFRGCPCSHQRFSVWESRQVNRGAPWVSPWALNVFCAPEVLGLVCRISQLTEVTWGLLLWEQEGRCARTSGCDLRLLRHREIFSSAGPAAEGGNSSLSCWPTF